MKTINHALWVNIDKDEWMETYMGTTLQERLDVELELSFCPCRKSRTAPSVPFLDDIRNHVGVMTYGCFECIVGGKILATTVEVSPETIKEIKKIYNTCSIKNYLHGTDAIRRANLF